MKERLKQLMESQGMTQQAFADYIGVSSAALSSIITGRNQLTLKTVDAIHNKYPNISLAWLIYGTGDMYVEQNDNQTALPSSTDHAEGSLDFTAASQPADAAASFSSESVKNKQNLSQMANTVKKLVMSDIKTIDKQQRRITEIRVFYDDQTWETFVPKK